MTSPRPSKRQRIYRACDQCRHRKSKCDGDQPVCSICYSAKRACTYQNGGGRRGLPSGYVRSLEIVLGLMFQHVPNSEATTHSVLRDYHGKGNFLTSGVAEHSHNIWRKSKLSRHVSQLLTPGSECLDDSEWEPIKTRDHGSIADQGSPHSISKPNEVSAICEIPVLPCETPTLPNWAIPDHTPDLLDFYFTYTHCWLPILERRDLLRAMHISPGRSASDLTSRQMLLWSVIIYSCALKGIQLPGQPALPAIQLYTQRILASNMAKLELDHIQSTLIVVLTHISMGNINQAWLSLGQAARMLAILPLNLRKGRFPHTFNGCIFLDNIISALLGKTPCLSLEEQLQQGPVDEDDVDEWEVWSAFRTKTPATPLQALSTFNSIRHLTQQTSQILYCTYNTLSNSKDILGNLRQQQAAILQTRPYNRDSLTTPPLLILHLTSAFTTLSLILKLGQVSSAILELCIRTIYCVLDMLDHYVEMTGAAGSSPIVHCFALQCQQALGICVSLLSSAEEEALQRRIDALLQSANPNSQFDGGDWLRHAIASASVSGTQSDQHNTPLIPIPATHSTQVNSATMVSHPEPPDINLPDPLSISDTTVPVGGGSEEYDALFEEMMLVGSFPTSRQEPSFAHNLGFYDGDLDTDFLAQLQQPSER
ncbi:hypothetical protein N7448_001698 [Penicillium atrosanguineum]|uniref:uncharacterized protein n=1 Tax=Penicillium atrosanguineum TaxID=1132637 RepID=UPI002384B957|nr:uncharacterized protein N7443_005095 [Penicillium atrosanguineum]KAJ5150120.1 hypothetical protein N7448_001698 [Penicillium atrosanguineum]KAJ5305435.1 hypothetical protein N7443_005095 [Penicillium atrosanguineum]